MRSIFFLVFIIATLSSPAQINLDIANPGSTGGNYGNVNVIDPSTLGTKKVELLNLSDLNGSPFWNDRWSKAFLYLKNGNLVKLAQVRLNIYSNEVDFINPHSVEMVLDASDFKKILMMKQDDTTRIAAVFECYHDFIDNKGEGFFRVLNGGKKQLYALYKAKLKEDPYDALLGKRTSSFYTKTEYAISEAEKFTPIKSLDKKSVLAAITPDPKAESWLDINRNKLRNETDVVAFFTYLNTAKK